MCSYSRTYCSCGSFDLKPSKEAKNKCELPLKSLNSEWWQPINLLTSGRQLASADVCSDSWPMQPETLKQGCEPKQSLALLCVPEVWGGDFVAAGEKRWRSYSLSPVSKIVATHLTPRLWQGCGNAYCEFPLLGRRILHDPVHTYTLSHHCWTRSLKL